MSGAWSISSVTSVMHDLSSAAYNRVTRFCGALPGAKTVKEHQLLTTFTAMSLGLFLWGLANVAENDDCQSQLEAMQDEAREACQKVLDTALAFWGHCCSTSLKDCFNSDPFQYVVEGLTPNCTLPAGETPESALKYCATHLNATQVHEKVVAAMEYVPAARQAAMQALGKVCSDTGFDVVLDLSLAPLGACFYRWGTVLWDQSNKPKHSDVNNDAAKEAFLDA
ncbi:MAG: hypothetical protein EBX40_07865 [Gammaproteobacteria bacterium]|nr:hypothetical protein [Gammaproteobacteria bacterium]